MQKSRTRHQKNIANIINFSRDLALFRHDQASGRHRNQAWLVDK